MVLNTGSKSILAISQIEVATRSEGYTDIHFLLVRLLVDNGQASLEVGNQMMATHICTTRRNGNACSKNNVGTYVRSSMVRYEVLVVPPPPIVRTIGTWYQ